jgi:pyruvate/2-oxoacid:ferredoxin oxidoreductase beta subunit
VETGYFPLWEEEYGKFNFTYIPRMTRPLKEFTDLTGRFAHLSEEELHELSEVVQSRFNLIEYLTKRNN